MKIIHKGEHTLLELLKSKNDNLVRKSSFGEARKKLMREADFIKTILPIGARKFFPRIVNVYQSRKDSEPSFFDMEYREGRLLRDLLFDESCPVEEIKKIIVKVLETLRDNLYQTSSKANPADFTKGYYVDRISERLKKFHKNSKISLTLEKSMYDLTFDEVRNLFTKVMSSDEIVINNKIIMNPLKIIGSIENDSLIAPRNSMVLIHGDTHFGNILISNEEPVFLDPNGIYDGGDLAYDLGKIILSVDILDSIYMKKLVSPIIKVKEHEYFVNDLDLYADLALAERISSIKKEIVEVMMPNIFSSYIKNDANLINRAVLVSHLHALACAHTFMSERLHISTHLFFHSLLKVNEYITSP